MRIKIYTIIIVMLMSLTVFASDTNMYTFSNDIDAKRFHAFTQDIRCMVCQNQSVAESNSMFAEDMKDWLYEAIENGQTDFEIKAALVKRFGDSVFYTPPFQANTWVLWGMPALFLIVGAGVFIFISRARRS